MWCFTIVTGVVYHATCWLPIERMYGVKRMGTENVSIYEVAEKCYCGTVMFNEDDDRLY